MFGSRFSTALTKIFASSKLFASSTNPLDQEITSDRIRAIAERGMHYPQLVDVAEVQELCGALMVHYESRCIDGHRQTVGPHLSVQDLPDG